MQVKKTLIISASLFAVTALTVLLVFSTEPEPKREAATKRTAMLVDVITAERGNYQPVISAMGTVKPAQDVSLRPRVSGHVIFLSENFVPGGFVAEGEVLLQIDPTDYRNQVAQRKSELAQAETVLSIEMGEQEIAKRDYERLNDKLSPMQKSLVLREPQLNAAKARVEAAKAAVNQAEAELERSKVRAPFAAQILERNANIGSQISSSEAVAHLVGLEAFWVEATVPLSTLPRISLQGENSVKIYNRTVWGKSRYREGRVHSIIGELEGQTRMARVLIEVQDPLATNADAEQKPALIVGSYVECEIVAESLIDVVKLPREYLRKQDTVWIMQDQTLSIRELDIAFLDDEFAYVSSGIQGGEQIVTTSLSRVREGAELRLKES